LREITFASVHCRAVVVLRGGWLFRDEEIATEVGRGAPGLVEVAAVQPESLKNRSQGQANALIGTSSRGPSGPPCAGLAG